MEDTAERSRKRHCCGPDTSGSHRDYQEKQASLIHDSGIDLCDFLRIDIHHDHFNVCSKFLLRDGSLARFCVDCAIISLEEKKLIRSDHLWLMKQLLMVILGTCSSMAFHTKIDIRLSLVAVTAHQPILVMKYVLNLCGSCSWPKFSRMVGLLWSSACCFSHPTHRTVFTKRRIAPRMLVHCSSIVLTPIGTIYSTVWSIFSAGRANYCSKRTSVWTSLIMVHPDPRYLNRGC